MAASESELRSMSAVNIPVDLEDNDGGVIDVELATPRARETTPRITGMSPDLKKAKVDEGGGTGLLEEDEDSLETPQRDIDRSLEREYGGANQEGPSSAFVGFGGSDGRGLTTARPNTPPGLQPSYPPNTTQPPTQEASPSFGAQSAMSGGARGAALTLDDLFASMQDGFRNMGTRMDAIQGSLQRDVSKLRHEQAETKEMAAKALTNSDQTKQQISQLAQRVTALENNPQKGGVGRSGSAALGASDIGDVGFNSLGGPKGNTVIIGKFAPYATKEARNQGWELIKGVLPPEIVDQVHRIETPGLRGPIILGHLVEAAGGPAETRNQMLDLCKRVKQGQYTYDSGGQSWDIYFSPSKSFAQRQLDAASTLKRMRYAT